MTDLRPEGGGRQIKERLESGDHLVKAKAVCELLDVSPKWLYASRLRDKAIRIHRNRNGLRWWWSDVLAFLEDCQGVAA